MGRKARDRLSWLDNLGPDVIKPSAQRVIADRTFVDTGIHVDATIHWSDGVVETVPAIAIGWTNSATDPLVCVRWSAGRTRGGRHHWLEAKDIRRVHITSDGRRVVLPRRGTTEP